MLGGDTEFNRFRVAARVRHPLLTFPPPPPPESEVNPSGHEVAL